MILYIVCGFCLNKFIILIVNFGICDNLIRLLLLEKELILFVCVKI